MKVVGATQVELKKKIHIYKKYKYIKGEMQHLKRASGEILGATSN